MPASRRRRATPPPAASSRGGPNWRCARRPRRGRAPSSPSSPRSTPSRPIRNSSSANCRARSPPTSWSCTISRSSPPMAARIVGVEALLRWTHADARADRAGGLHPGRRADGPDGHARRLRAAPRAQRSQALARSLCGGQPVAAAGARRVDRRSGALGAGRERRAAVAADAGNHRGRADRQSGRDGQAHRGPARARRAHRARRFRLRLFQSRLSAALPARQAQDRPQLRASRSATPPMAG